MYEHDFGIGTHIAAWSLREVCRGSFAAANRSVETVGPWSKVFVEQKNGEEAEQEEQGNWKKETSLLITPKFTMQSTENILALLSK